MVFFILSETAYTQNDRALSISMGARLLNSSTKVHWSYYSPVSRIAVDRTIVSHNVIVPVQIRYSLDTMTSLGCEYSEGRFLISQPSGFGEKRNNKIQTIGFFMESKQYIKKGVHAFFDFGIRYTITNIQQFNPFYIGYESPYTLYSKWNGLGANLSMGFMLGLADSGLSVKPEVGILYEHPTLTEFKVGDSGSTMGDISSKLFNYGAYIGVDLVYRISFEKK